MKNLQTRNAQTSSHNKKCGNVSSYNFHMPPLSHQYSLCNQVMINLYLKLYISTNVWKKEFQAILSNIVKTGKFQLMKYIVPITLKDFYQIFWNMVIVFGAFHVLGMLQSFNHKSIILIYKKFPNNKEEQWEMQPKHLFLKIRGF